MQAVEDLGFTKPTPVQADAIPPALAGRDVLACAMTGSGKTAAFLLPIMQRLKDRPTGRTRALILSPTRELAAQTHQHFEDLAKHSRIRGAAVFGGVGMKPQEDAFRRGVEIIAATPGRLLDHMQYDYAKLADIEILVLDEADRMLDMGFLPDIKRIMRQLPAKARQTMLFSATIPAPILELSRTLLDNPARIAVERRQAPATGVTQTLYPVPSNLKVELLIELLRRDEIGNAIVFCRTKHRSNRLAEKIERAGFETARIHGNRSQNQRTEALAGFKSGLYRVLVATDIVARGIDVEALEHVVNFDVPNVPEDYIHRVGRTARAEATGDAFTFVSPDEENDMRAIERAVGRRIERRQVEGFDYTAKTTEKLEVPIGDRIAEIRARKKDERSRARANAEKKAARQASGGSMSGSMSGGTSGGSATGGRASSRTSDDAAPRRRRRRGGRSGQGGSGSQSSAA
ncbi:MAG: DEAD/DEAH box helicase [Gemmatimonadetes bacterium]|nr:DEAD/DEAH box helicase [Gemmatimonadota bacterium]